MRKIQTRAQRCDTAEPFFDNYIDVNELCNRLSVSRSHVYNQINRGLPHLYVGKKALRFNMDEVIAWFQHESSYHD